MDTRNREYIAPYDARAQIHDVVGAASQVVLGKRTEIRLAMACLLARGHLLIEDLPGVGKTTLAHLLAKLIGLSYKRIQFTSDLLPADVIGVYVYKRETGDFEFHPGPVFSHVVLADEVNRATPRAQSALLEAMEERQVTIENDTHPLPEPFFVIATQNPGDQVGTFPLPESQLDRFLMRISLGYPDRVSERKLLIGQDRREMIEDLVPVLDAQSLAMLQQQVDAVHASDALLDYVQDLIRFSRESSGLVTGLSPRAGRALMRAAKAWALIDGRAHVLPDDVQAVLASVASHRLRTRAGDDVRDITAVVDALKKSVPIP